MDPQTIDEWLNRVAAERERSSPPVGFPELPDLPAGRYTNPSFFELERRRLWQRSWLYAAHIDQLRAPGDYLLWPHGSAPIFLIRGDDNTVRAFYNTCRHRGAPVLRESSGSAKKRLVCGYHGWSYDWLGNLTGVSESRDWQPAQYQCKKLIPVQCQQFGNWLFVNEDNSAESLKNFLAPVARFIQHLPLEQLRLVHRESIDVSANAKVLLENFLEAYHFNLLHADTTHRIFDNRGTSIHLWDRGHSMMLSPNRRSDWIDPGVVGMPEISGTTAIERSHNPSYCVFPNLILPISPSGIPGVAIWPKSIDRSVLEILWFAPLDDHQARDPLWATRIANFARIVEEDIQFAEPIQETLHSKGFTGVPLSYQERRIYHWHASADSMIGPENIPQDLRVANLLQNFIE